MAISQSTGNLDSNRTSYLQLTRPAFRAYLDDEKKTIAMVRDVADLLESIAAGPLHTPALYSSFLNALISSQADGQTPTPASESANQKPDSGAPRPSGNGDQPQPQATSGEPGGFNLMSGNFDASLSGPEFNFNSEMGPVMDITTFPPTMAPSEQSGDMSGMMTMDSILSSGFWDSVLVPGLSYDYNYVL